eukprot:5449226-Pyramimonas_sp.AAC.1
MLSAGLPPLLDPPAGASRLCLWRAWAAASWKRFPPGGGGGARLFQATASSGLPKPWELARSAILSVTL